MKDDTNLIEYKIHTIFFQFKKIKIIILFGKIFNGIGRQFYNDFKKENNLNLLYYHSYRIDDLYD